MINFISNLPHDLRSGGFSALNAAAFAALRRSFEVHYAGPINPPAILWQKALAKLQRVSGSKSDFSFFAPLRLNMIARQVHARCRDDARLDFFQGFTPWILSEAPRPYVALSDCIFNDYINVYHSREYFRSKDIERIERAEAEWLKNAQCVFFTSDWAAQRAVSCYGLDASRVSSTGIFGEIDMPVRDGYAGGKQFAFLSTNFEAKGGRVVLAAFREVRRRHADVSLIVVGDRPTTFVSEPGVELVGFLRKENPDEHRRYRDILITSRGLVQPTKSDISPLIVIEAGYFGCPVISSRRFAIPELIDDSRTGLLIEDPTNVSTIATAMNWMLEQKDDYYQMREATWAKARSQHSKRQFDDRLLACMGKALQEL